MQSCVCSKAQLNVCVPADAAIEEGRSLEKERALSLDAERLRKARANTRGTEFRY